MGEHRDGLEFYTSEQLIRELVNRTTFVGMVICSEAEAKGVSGHKHFCLQVSDNLGPHQALFILDSIVEQMKTAG